MPFRTIPETDTTYGLLSFDARGDERLDDPDGLMSQRLIERAADGGVTNIFLFAHGWNGDMDDAQRQFDLWIRALDSLAADKERAATVFPGFSPLYIGVHWPSKWWGNESAGMASFGGDAPPDLDQELSIYLDWLGDTPAVRAAVSTILVESATKGRLSAAALEAFEALNAALDVNVDADADGIEFDAHAAGRSQAASFGSFGGQGKDLLRMMSYFSMKKRAREIGEGAVHNFVRQLQRATAARATPIHLMGHSFGSVVVSSAVGGPGGRAPLERPIDSVALIQGAVSLWSYASSIPDHDQPGYFHDVVAKGKVRGPLITTRSRNDTAVNVPYTWASKASRAVAFGGKSYFPRYGAVGRYGLQGLPDGHAVNAELGRADQPCGFECGKVYNLDATTFICAMDGRSGAHNDIGGPEVAHAIWEAAFASAHAGNG